MTHHTSEAGSREKRRHARKATLQAVQLRFGEAAAIPAEIRDYCQTGLYVAFPGGRTPDSALPALVGTLVGAGFSVGEGDASRSHQLNGWVARVAPGGVGIFVPAMPEAALQTLRAASARLAAGAQARPGLDPQQAQALQQECTSLFRNFLDAVMQEFFLQSMERLAQAGQDEMSFLERARYEYGAQELVQHRSRIEDDFFNAIRERIQHVGPVSDLDRRAPGANTNTLKLVDEAEFEDWLNLSAVINQIETDITPQLNEFEQRYSRLVGAPIDRKSNPFGPEMIGRAFQGAIQGLDFTNPMRTVLYKGLGRAVSSHGPALYRQLNQTLASLQPLAPVRHKDKPRPVAAENGPVAADSTKAKPDLAEIAETLNRLYKQDQASHSQMPESAEYSLDRILATLNQSQRRPTSRALTGAPAMRSSPQGDVPAGHAVASSEVLSMVGRLRQTARQLVGHDGQPRPTLQTGLTEASLHDLLAALDGLPLPNPTAVAGSPMSASLAEQIDLRIASTAGAGKRLAPAHRQILDTTSALFNQARADFVPSSEVELLVKRLERPLLKLALQDTNFPSLPDHPARQVLNLIEQYAVAADDKGKFFDAKLQRFLYLLVDRVCSRAAEDPGVFEMVRDSLEKVLLPILQIRRMRVARLQEAGKTVSIVGDRRIAWALLAIREDVGRHNALDKIIGTRFLAGETPLRDTIVLVSGRAGFELVQHRGLVSQEREQRGGVRQEVGVAVHIQDRPLAGREGMQEHLELHPVHEVDRPSPPRKRGGAQRLDHDARARAREAGGRVGVDQDSVRTVRREQIVLRRGDAEPGLPEDALAAVGLQHEGSHRGCPPSRPIAQRRAYLAATLTADSTASTRPCAPSRNPPRSR